MRVRPCCDSTLDSAALLATTDPCTRSMQKRTSDETQLGSTRNSAWLSSARMGLDRICLTLLCMIPLSSDLLCSVLRCLTPLSSDLPCSALIWSAWIRSSRLGSDLLCSALMRLFALLSCQQTGSSRFQRAAASRNLQLHPRALGTPILRSQ